MFKKIFIRTFVRWLPFAVLATILSGLVYGAVQQDLRITGNDPQIQIAEDVAAGLASGVPPQQVVPTQKTDLSKSLGPYIVIYDDKGKELASSVQLNGKTPSLPDGVLDKVKKDGEQRFTWQPAAGVRSAVVISHYGGPKPGFVLAGRSLREIEKREDRLVWEVLAGWIAALVGTFVTIGAIKVFKHRREETPKSSKR